ncbi:MAG: PEP/pyruvate-binding domain-containing protein [Verrucomicrobia bacterium]|nr:PEP/pyruvate-binding domain-containing protein [Verrucomicrobiota bacterium]
MKMMRQAIWWLAAILVFTSGSRAQDSLTPDGFGGSNQFRLIGSVPGDTQNRRVYEVLRSADWSTWHLLATAHHWPFEYEDFSAGDRDAAFYRLGVRTKDSRDDWKNLVVIPGLRGARYVDEPFFSQSSGAALFQPTWIKFAILLNEPDRVIYQDSSRYTFHYDFAIRRIASLSGLNRSQFDAVALHPGDSQQVVLGAVLHPRYSGANEVGIQFVGASPYPPELIAHWFERVRSTVNASPGTMFYYMPTFEQSALDSQVLELLRNRGVTVASPDRWQPGNGVYSEGWGMGVLRFVKHSEISQAYSEGRLRSEDILLTDGVPAEIPMVAGVVSLSPATPNSHVALLAQSFNIPFAYLRDSGERERVMGLAGTEVYFSASTGFFFNSESDTRVRIVPIGATVPESLRGEMLGLKAPGKLDYIPREALGEISRNTSSLTTGDVRYFGGKASNFGLLRRTLPDRSPEAIGLSFDLWEGFLNQPVNGGGTLRAFIDAALQPFQWPVRDMAALERTLDTIRERIRSGRFTDLQRQAVVDSLQLFDPASKIRFRSSTNMEDSDTFVGAGLYDSYSGCLQDDIDGDESGPSGCDPLEPEERGVFRAIRKVYASFYNLNAFLQRLRFGVLESEVGMAVLVHHSFPDEFERANGVAVVRESFGDRWEAEIVSQQGATSVSNPERGVVPETVRVVGNTGGISWVSQEEPSNLVVQGARVMNWEADYRSLAGSLFTVYDAYRRTLPQPEGLALDFEFKKMNPTGLVIKQVRPLPQAGSEQVSPFLLDEPVAMATAQGEGGQELLGRHRLKIRVRMQLASVRLSEPILPDPFLKHLDLEYLDGEQVRKVGLDAASLDGYTQARTATGMELRWTLPVNGEAVRMTVTIEGFPSEVSVARDVAVTLRDSRVTVSALHAIPQQEFVYLNGSVQLGTTRQDSVTLAIDRSTGTPSALSSVQTRKFAGGALAVESKFYWPPPPSGPSAGYTAPVQKWVETVITGIADEPIVLKGFFSQTYLPGHHNFFESFVFQPSAEEGISEEVLERLKEVNLDKIVCEGEPSSVGTIRIIGLDGKLRQRL